MAYDLQLSTSPALPNFILLHFCEYIRITTEKFTLRTFLKECEQSLPRVAVHN